MTNKCIWLQNHTCVKDSFKMQDRPIDFSVTKHENLVDMTHIQYAINLQETYHFSNFDVVSKNIHSYLKRFLNTPTLSNHLHKPDFPHILQQKWYITTDSMQKQI
jgi:hypothetical protein